jgi:hypothetical protein
VGGSPGGDARGTEPPRCAAPTVRRGERRPRIQDGRRLLLRRVCQRFGCHGGGGRGAAGLACGVVAGSRPDSRSNGTAHGRRRNARRRLLWRDAESNRPVACSRPRWPVDSVKSDPRPLWGPPPRGNDFHVAGRARPQGFVPPGDGLPGLPSRPSASLSSAPDADVARRKPALHRGASVPQHEPRRGERVLRRWLGGGTPEHAHEDPWVARGVAHVCLLFQREGHRHSNRGTETERCDDSRGQCAEVGHASAHCSAAHPGGHRLPPVVGNLRPDVGGHFCGAGRHCAVGRERVASRVDEG